MGQGREGRTGAGRQAMLRWSWQERAAQSCRNLLPPLSWESRAQLREVEGATPSLAAFTRPLKFAATVRAALTPEALRA